MIQQGMKKQKIQMIDRVIYLQLKLRHEEISSHADIRVERECFQSETTFEIRWYVNGLNVLDSGYNVISYSVGGKCQDEMIRGMYGCFFG